MVASVYLFLIKDNKILLLRRCNTGYEDGNYGLPSGHVEENESISHALVRETEEEIGIQIKIEDIKLVHVMNRKENDERVDFFFSLAQLLDSGTPYNKEPHKCDDLQWFPIDNLPINTVGYVKRALENVQNNIFYSESGWG